MDERIYIRTILLSIVLNTSCTRTASDRIAKIELNWTSNEMVFPSGFCEEYYSINGKKQKILCYANEKKKQMESSMFFEYDKIGDLVNLKYKSDYFKDTILYSVDVFQKNCYTSIDKNWKICLDQTTDKVQSTHYGTNLPVELWSEYKKFRYDKEGLLIGELEYTSDGDIGLGRSFYLYTEFDLNGNWTERQAYFKYEYLDDEEGINIHEISDSLRTVIMNDFITKPIEGDNPHIQKRKIEYY